MDLILALRAATKCIKKRRTQSEILQPREEAWPHICRFELTEQVTVGAFADEFISEQRSQRDDVLLNPDNLHHLHHPANAIAHTLGVHDEIDRARYLAADRPDRQI